MAKLTEGEDYYFEGRFVVFTEAYLRRRGYCCESGCRHCPWGYRRQLRIDVPNGDCDDAVEPDDGITPEE